jgi:hypothetical protein
LDRRKTKTAGLESGPRFKVMLYDPDVYGGHASLRVLRHHQYPVRQDFFRFVDLMEFF